MEMDKGPVRVLVCDTFPEGALTPLSDRGYLVDLRPKIPQHELRAALAGCTAVLLRSRIKITADVLEEAGDLRVIARAGGGVDNIDVDEATRRRIIVINTPDGNTVSAAELAVGHMISLARHIPQAHSKMREGGWDRGIFVGTELRGKTLGIIGLGHVGREVAEMVVGFRMNVVGFDPKVTKDAAEQMGVQLLPFEDVLRRSDFVTVHVPLLDSTRGLINREALALMKRGARLINVARGEVVDNAALIEALDNGRLAGAALDVFAKEPPDSDDPVRLHPKIILTPHLGASTEEAQDRVAREAALGIIDILEGRPFRGALNLPEILRVGTRQRNMVLS